MIGRSGGRDRGDEAGTQPGTVAGRLRVEMRTVGSSGRSISVLGYGAWTTGADTASTDIDRVGLERAIRTALDAGVTWIDTAEIYAAGASEEIVGRAVRPVRDDVFIVTKVGPTGAGSGMRPRDLTDAIHGSLRRLGTDRVDLYLLHWHDPSVPLEDTWAAMTALVDEGLALGVGVSNFGSDLIGRCVNVGPLDAVQNQMSLLHRHDRALAARLADQGVAFIAYGALAFGLLSGRVGTDTVLDPSDWRAGGFARYESNYYEELFAPGRMEQSRAFARGLAELAGAVGVPAAVLALGWVIEQPGVTATIIGSLDPSHIRANARAGAVRLDPETVKAIDDLLERHGGAVQETGSKPSPFPSTRD